MKYLLLLLLAGCAAGPKIHICIWSARRVEFDCVDPEGVPYVCRAWEDKCDKMVATTQEDWARILEWARDQK